MKLSTQRMIDKRGFSLDSSKLCQIVTSSMYGNCEGYFSPAGEEYRDQESEKRHDDRSNLVHLV